MLDSVQTITSLQHGGSQAITVGAVMAGVSITSVTLQFAIKLQKRISLGLDDLFIALSIATFLAAEGLILRAVFFGRSATTSTDTDYSAFLQLFFVYSLFYWSILASAAISLLFLYRRLFPTSNTLRKASVGVAILMGCWWLSGTLVNALAYQPTYAYWNHSVKGGYTMHFDAFWLSSMVLELTLEATTLALPIWEMVRSAHSLGRKFLFASFLTMGGLVLVTGIGRLYYVKTQDDIAGNIIWFSVHSTTAIVTACLPTYAILFGINFFPVNKPYNLSQNRKQYTRMNSHSNIQAPSPAYSTTKARRTNIFSISSKDGLTALPAINQNDEALELGASHQKITLNKPRRALFAEVDRSLKQMASRPESWLDRRRSRPRL